MTKISLLIFALIVTGCTTKVEIVRITDENKDQINGIRFYMPKPYLLIAEKDVMVDGNKKVSKDKDGREVVETEKMALPEKDLVASIIYLPNPQQEYAVKNVTNDQSINLVDGWRLEGVNNKSDLKANKHVLEVLTGMKDINPGMYEIIYNEAGSIETLRKIQIVK